MMGIRCRGRMVASVAWTGATVSLRIMAIGSAAHPECTIQWARNGSCGLEYAGNGRGREFCFGRWKARIQFVIVMATHIQFSS